MRKNAGSVPKPDRPPPDEAALREAALAYLARFSATEAGLARVLARKVDRWMRSTSPQGQEGGAAQRARACIPAIVRELAAGGAVNDVTFAEARSRSLARAGRSRRAIGAHLATRGVGADLASASLPADPAQELAAALIHARKRRLGPWRKQMGGKEMGPKATGSPDIVRRELGSFARAGFAHDVAKRVLAYGLAEAEAAIAAFRSGT